MLGTTLKTIATLFPLLAATVFVASSCATSSGREHAIDQTLYMCQLLAEPGIERKADGEIWYWYQVERAKTSHKLWSSKGAQALEARLAQTPDGRGNLCLQRALREALSHKVEHSDIK